MNIILCGGGTAGHITPAIALYDAFKKEGHTCNLVVAKKDAALIPRGYDFRTLNLNPPGNIKKNILFILLFLPSLLKSREYIKKYSPSIIIGMGGFISLPMLFMARFMKIRIFICEQNSIPGKANRMFAKYSVMNYLSFSKSLEYMPKGKLYGNPVRSEFFIINRDNARKQMNLKDDDKLLVVMGGSQGALKLNKLFLESIENIKKNVSNLHIVWLAGPKWYKEMEENIKKYENVLVYSYYKDMPVLLHAADFAVSRAGSSSISEIIAVNVPSLLVPFPYAADNHQYYNARELLDKDMAYLMQESQLDKTKLENIIINNLKDEKRLQTIRNNIKENGTSNSASFIVNDIIGRVS